MNETNLWNCHWRRFRHHSLPRKQSCHRPSLLPLDNFMGPKTSCQKEKCALLISLGWSKYSYLCLRKCRFSSQSTRTQLRPTQILSEAASTLKIQYAITGISYDDMQPVLWDADMLVHFEWRKSVAISEGHSSPMNCSPSIFNGMGHKNETFSRVQYSAASPT